MATRTFLPEPEKAKSDKSNTGLVMIPFYSILRIGRIFVEGLRYGRDNWKKGVGDQEFQEERLEHALLHLIKWKEGDRTEDHLAKVAWFCVTQMELERLENEEDVVKRTLLEAMSSMEQTESSADHKFRSGDLDVEIRTIAED